MKAAVPAHDVGPAEEVARQLVASTVAMIQNKEPGRTIWTRSSTTFPGPRLAQGRDPAFYGLLPGGLPGSSLLGKADGRGTRSCRRPSTGVQSRHRYGAFFPGRPSGNVCAGEGG